MDRPHWELMGDPIMRWCWHEQTVDVWTGLHMNAASLALDGAPISELP